MKVEVTGNSLKRWDIVTRMPFKYGIATMTKLPHVFVSVTVRIDGVECSGQSADHLPPKWFTKEPEMPVEREIADMETVIRQALEEAGQIKAISPFSFWKELYLRLMSPPQFPPLLQHFGISLVERAILDAVCRHTKKPLWKLIHNNQLGIDLGSLSPELSGLEAADFLAETPLGCVNLRHTVGMADYLREDDIPAEERLDDGLPQSLEACISRYGLREFKLKLSGQAEADLQRLRNIASVVQDCCQENFSFSLDGNEQFASPDTFRAFGDQVHTDPKLAGFFKHLIFIEQPISRKVALSEDAPNVRDAWPRPVPIIIDESDGALEDFPRALELGYAGVSHKNCKGVFKGIRNRCLIGWHQRKNPAITFLMTGEDLANIGPIALLQDLAVQALLGNKSVERNGHHYFRGLTMFPKEISSSILNEHADLYQAGKDNAAYLHPLNGQLSLASINRAPFGCADSGLTIKYIAISKSAS